MNGRVVCLSGGVGGAKLLLGLQRVLSPGELTAVVNTGDDFDHLGLRICPDLDTSLYTLSGLANRQQGWGRRDETWHCLDTLEAIGGDTWFRLGDADLALHLLRSQQLREGRSLSSITAELGKRLAIPTQLLPMTDGDVRTMIAVDDGELAFQDYFVRHRCAPVLRDCRFDGADSAVPADAVVSALSSPLRAVVIAPSNPWLSIAPILALPGMKELLVSASAPVIAVTPVMGGAAVKGPTAKIMAELGLEVIPEEVVNFYGDIIDGFVLDNRDHHLADRLALPLAVTDTLMRSDDDRERVARAALELADSLAIG